MRIQFNTGRGYSPMGQPITAIQYDDCVKFRDGRPVDVKAMIEEIKV